MKWSLKQHYYASAESRDKEWTKQRNREEKTARLINETVPGQLQADGIDSLSGLVVHLRWDGVSLHDVNHQTETERDRQCTAEIINA